MTEAQPSEPKKSRGGPAFWLATGFGVGFSPWAPGTCGAALGVPLSVAISAIPSIPGQIACIVALFLLGVWVCTRVARDRAMHDPQFVVWDELATVPIVFLFIPADQMFSPIVLLAGFLLHRLFDVTKPPPARQLERLPEGWGIMADDLAAAMMAFAVLHGAFWLGVFG